MAQFDVYANPNPRSNDMVPCVVDVQSALLDALPTRLVMPLSPVGVNPQGMTQPLIPVFSVAGEKPALHAHQSASIDARLLKKRVASVRQHAGEVCDVLDAVVSGG
jgi:toxin CcdB